MRKEWREKLGELSFMKGYYFKLEDNGLVEKKDDQLVFNREELEHFIEQELDKAREEGYIDCLKEIIKLGKHFQESKDIRRLSKALEIRLETELSKLKDNK